MSKLQNVSSLRSKGDIGKRSIDQILHVENVHEEVMVKACTRGYNHSHK